MQSDRLILSENAGERVTFWSHLAREGANQNEGAGILSWLDNGWNRVWE